MDKNRKLTLEQRIARLEKLLKVERHTSKNEGGPNSKDLKARLKNEALKKHLPARYSYDSLEYDINETSSYDINDILAAYARVGQKPKKILKELLASGDIDEWAKECACSTEELYSSIEESMYDYDDTSSITVEGQDGNTAKCKVVLPDGKAFTVYMPVYTSESDFDEDDDDNDMDEKLEAKIAKLERLVSEGDTWPHGSWYPLTNNTNDVELDNDDIYEKTRELFLYFRDASMQAGDFANYLTKLLRNNKDNEDLRELRELADGEFRRAAEKAAGAASKIHELAEDMAHGKDRKYTSPFS